MDKKTYRKTFTKLLWASISAKLGNTGLSNAQKVRASSIYEKVDTKTFQGYPLKTRVDVMSNVIVKTMLAEQRRNKTHRTRRSSNELVSYGNTSRRNSAEGRLLHRETNRNRQPIELMKGSMDTKVENQSKNKEAKRKEEEEIDIHEMQKRELGVTTGKSTKYASHYLNADERSKEIKELKKATNISIQQLLGIDDLYTLTYLFNREALYTYRYANLDTDNRVLNTESGANTTEFKWHITSTQNEHTGYVNIIGDLRDIIGMRMYQPRVHYLAAMDTDAKRVSVLIKELGAQAVLSENGKRYHFLYRPILAPTEYTPAETQIELTTEDYNDGIYMFRKPFTTINSITLEFGNPLTVLEFPTSTFERMQFNIEFICLKSK